MSNLYLLYSSSNDPDFKMRFVLDTQNLPVVQVLDNLLEEFQDAHPGYDEISYFEQVPFKLYVYFSRKENQYAILGSVQTPNPYRIWHDGEYHVLDFEVTPSDYIKRNRLTHFRVEIKNNKGQYVKLSNSSQEWL